MKQWSKILMWALIVSAFVIRFAASLTPDIYGDDALFSFRAFGWTDDFGGIMETGPLGWLGYTPAWAMLSFHDHPVAVFFVQHIFFSLFGDGTVIARLPFVIAGAVSVWLVWRFLYKEKGVFAAGIGAGIVMVSYIGVWVVTTGLIEGLLMVWLILAYSVSYRLLFGGESLRIRSIYGCAAILAIILSTKYTALFVVVPICGAFLISMWKYHTIKYVRHYCAAIALFFVLMSPVLIYNAKVYQLRGHFDVAASAVFGMHSKDFGQVDGRVAHIGGLENILKIGTTYKKSVSWPLFVIVLVSFFLLLGRVLLRRANYSEVWLLVFIASFCAMEMFSGITERMMPMLLPYIALLIALEVGVVFEWCQSKDAPSKFSKIIRYGLYVVVGGCFVIEAIYMFNTTFILTTGRDGLFSSQMKVESLGFNQVDSIIRPALEPLPIPRAITNLKQLALSADQMKGHSAVVYDNRLNWNAILWYFWRYQYFYRLPVMPSVYITGATNGTKLNLNDVLYTTERPTYFIQAVSEKVMSVDRIHEEVTADFVTKLSEYLLKNNFKYQDVVGGNGQPMFRIFIIDRAIKI